MIRNISLNDASTGGILTTAPGLGRCYIRSKCCIARFRSPENQDFLLTFVAGQYVGTCFGVSSGDLAVCSGFGTCSGYNWCDCDGTIKCDSISSYRS